MASILSINGNDSSDLIDIEVFIKTRELCKNVPESMQSKTEILQKSFRCFQENQDILKTSSVKSDTRNKWTRKTIQGNAVQPQPIQGSNIRPIIGLNRELSKEDRIKRDFMGFINKLTDANVKNISSYFNNNLYIEYIDIYIRLLWEAMLRSADFQHLYIQCLEEICKQVDNQNNFNYKLEAIWLLYKTDTKWIPVDELINDKNYDDFCDFVKWKKTAITYIQSFAKCIHKSWLSQNIYADLIDEFIGSIKNFLIDSPEGCKVIDALYDQLLIILEYTSKSQDEPVIIFISLQLNSSSTYRPSTRFKIYDIKEFLDRKSKYCVKLKN